MNRLLGYCKSLEFIILTAHNANAIPAENSVNERANERLVNVLFENTNLENIAILEGCYGGLREESYIASIRAMHPDQNSRGYLVHLLREFNQESGIHFVNGEFRMVYSDGRPDLVAVGVRFMQGRKNRPQDNYSQYLGVRFMQGRKNRPQDNYSQYLGTEDYMQIEFDWPE